MLHVSIHAPARGATRDWWKPAGHPLVSIHAPARGATEGARPPPLCINVSIHAPARGATFLAGSSASSSSSFNPRARAGRDVLAQLDVAPVTVSIHAPARGATRHEDDSVQDSIVSIHAPARGATYYMDEASVYRTVSIHAPARGATGISEVQEVHEGFQSTRPRGARRRRTRPFERWRCFNPRARAGRDGVLRVLMLVVHVSIHAPARGATEPGERYHPVPTVSIHAPARGATQVHNAISVYFKFQSTRPRGARPASEAGLDRILKFQSTRPRGARPVGDRSERHLHPVSIHAPARGATELQAAIGGSPLFQSTRPRGARPEVEEGLR